MVSDSFEDNVRLRTRPRQEVIKVDQIWNDELFANAKNKKWRIMDHEKWKIISHFPFGSAELATLIT
jgi:hypothetical protein